MNAEREGGVLLLIVRRDGLEDAAHDTVRHAGRHVFDAVVGVVAGVGTDWRRRGSIAAAAARHRGLSGRHAEVDAVGVALVGGFGVGTAGSVREGRPVEGCLAVGCVGRRRLVDDDLLSGLGDDASQHTTPRHRRLLR